MGLFGSENKVDGDAQVSIINKLEQHSEAHADHQIKIWAILIICAAHFVLAVYTIYTKRVRAKAYAKAMKSVSNLNTV